MVWVHYIIVYCAAFVSLLISKSNAFNFPCITWEGLEGVCVNLDSCHGFRDALHKNQATVSNLWKNSTCYKNNKNTVCCIYNEGKLNYSFRPTYRIDDVSLTSAKNISSVSYAEITTQLKNIVNRHLLPVANICGKQQVDNRLLDETDTTFVEPDEFTWLAHIIPKESTNITCTGALISPKLVLTSYICGLNAKKVQLGMHRLNNSDACFTSNPDDDFQDCRTSLEERDVVFVGDPSVPEVGILKLKKSIRYSDFIRAICLPFEENVQPKLNQYMYVSGWNLIDDKNNENSKQKLVYKLTNKEDCNHLNHFSDLEEEKTFCVVATRNLTMNSQFERASVPIIYLYNEATWYLAGFQWLTLPPKNNSNEINGNRILCSTMTLHTMKWILDNLS